VAGSDALSDPDLARFVRSIPDHPRPGILFRDITTLLQDAEAFARAVAALAAPHRGTRVDAVAGIESRGFIVGAALAHALGAGFVPLRKAGKLPAAVVGRDYALEYGTDRIEMHVDAVRRGDRVVLADDLIATGGTAEAAVALLEEAGAVVVECAFLIELPALGGRARLQQRGAPVRALLSFPGD
jgi:adenine phosphoribosyltransferase